MPPLEWTRVSLTFFNAKRRVWVTRRLLPVKLFTRTLRSGVAEAVVVSLWPLKDELKNLISLAAQYGSLEAEFFWVNDRALTSKAMDFVDSVNGAPKGRSYADSIEDILFR